MKKEDLNSLLIPTAKQRFQNAEELGIDVDHIIIHISGPQPNVHDYSYYDPEAASHDTLVDMCIDPADPQYTALRSKIAEEIRREVKDWQEITKRRKDKAFKLKEIAAFLTAHGVDQEE